MLRKAFASWAKKEEGTTAIEFALMAFPYLFLVLGIIELSMMYAAGTLLEGATASASRMIRTGQLQQSGAGDPEQVFRNALCNYATVLIRCNDVVIEVQPMTNFTDYASMQPQYDEDGNMVSSGFSMGGSDSKMLIRTSYRYTMMNPFAGVLLLGPTNSRLFMSTIIMQTEPYNFGGA